MGTHLHTSTDVILWPGESVVAALERLARAWDLDRAQFVGRTGALGRVALRVGPGEPGRPTTRAVSWADVVCLAGEVRAEAGIPVVDAKAVLRRARVLERGRSEYLTGDLLDGEVREPIEIVLCDREVPDRADGTNPPRPAHDHDLQGEAAAVIV